jgi:hypothetical protein
MGDNRVRQPRARVRREWHTGPNQAADNAGDKRAGDYQSE